MLLNFVVCAAFTLSVPCYLLPGSSCQIKQEKRDASPIQGVSRVGMKAMRKGIATAEAKDERHCRAHAARSEGALSKKLVIYQRGDRRGRRV